MSLQCIHMSFTAILACEKSVVFTGHPTTQSPSHFTYSIIFSPAFPLFLGYRMSFYGQTIFQTAVPPIELPLQVSVEDRMYFTLGAVGPGGSEFFTEECTATTTDIDGVTTLSYTFIKDGYENILLKVIGCKQFSCLLKLVIIEVGHHSGRRFIRCRVEREAIFSVSLSVGYMT